MTSCYNVWRDWAFTDSSTLFYQSLHLSYLTSFRPICSVIVVTIVLCDVNEYYLAWSWLYLQEVFELEAAFTELFLSCTVGDGAGVEVVIGEAWVGTQQVRLDAARWLHSHLGPVLQDIDRKLGTRHTRQPHAEVLVHLRNTAWVTQLIPQHTCRLHHSTGILLPW